MRAASSGLRHPASASCLGRHSHLAGRCPNSCSLFPPLAAVVVVAAERLFLIEQCRSVCGRSGIAFSREGVVTANGSCRACFLRKRRRGGKVFAALDTFSTKGNGVRPLSQSLWLCQLSQRESQEHCQNLSHCTQYFSIEVNGLAPPLRKDFPRSGGRCHRR